MDPLLKNLIPLDLPVAKSVGALSLLIINIEPSPLWAWPPLGMWAWAV